MKRIKIIRITLFALILMILGTGIYKFNFTDDDIYYSGENIQPESHKIFVGSWILEKSKFKEGFTLDMDSAASSINTATLLYKTWKIDQDSLVLSAISLGNHTASVSNEKYSIKLFNNKRLLLEKSGKEYWYKKVKPPIKIKTENNTSLSTSFEYFPIDALYSTSLSDSNHPIDFSSNLKAAQNKTAILKLYRAVDINFSGYYIIIDWSCGTGCREGVMIDTRDGKVYNLPSKKGYIDFGSDIEMYANSILLATKFVDSTYIPNTKNREVEITFWIWNESTKEFIYYTTLKEITNA